MVSFRACVPIGIFFIYSSFLLDGAALAALAERDRDHNGSAAPVLFLYTYQKEGGAEMAKRKSPSYDVTKYGNAPKYTDPKEMQAKIDRYFEECEGHPLEDEEGKPVFDRFGHPIIVGKHPPTFSGLAIALGFCGRQALQNYKPKAGFRDVLLRALGRVEAYTEGRLFDRDGSRGAQFSLAMNFGWEDEDKDQGGPVVNIIADIPKEMQPVLTASGSIRTMTSSADADPRSLPSFRSRS